MTITEGPGSVEIRQPTGRSTAHAAPVQADVPDPPQAMQPTASVGRRWAQTLRVHLSVIIVMLLVGISVPLMLLTYRQGSNEAIAAAEKQMKLLSQHTLDRYRSLFEDGYSIATVAPAVQLLSAEPPANAEAKTDFMIRVLRGSPNIDGIYVGYPSGSFVQALNVSENAQWREAISAPQQTAFAIRTIVRSSLDAVAEWRFLDSAGQLVGQRGTAGVAFDPRKRPWYRAAYQATSVVAVGPYVSGSTGSLTLTFASPHTADGSIIVGVDVLLETISRLLAGESVSEHARGYVFDQQQRLIVHSDPGVMALVLDSLAAAPKSSAAPLETLDPALDAVRELLLAGNGNQDRTVRFDVGSQPYLAEVSHVDFAGMLRDNAIVVAAPLEDFTGPSALLLRQTLSIAAVVVLAGIIAALLVARGISKALTMLARDARQIGNLEFEGRAPAHSWIVEINTLSSALASARNAIGNFALYVPRELVRRIVASGQSLAGSAIRQEVTVLFTDIRDFTTIAERQSPEDVTSLLSDYFQVMNEIVERHNGVIIQYLGDSICAMWNAPTSDAEHVGHGCRCALALKTGIDAFNDRSRASNLPVLITRYGLHAGTAVVGSVGALNRRQYTAMGDTVNVASRLEGLNKEFGTTILVSGAW